MNGNLGLRAGLRDAMPLAAAYMPIAFAVGAAASQQGFSVLESAMWSAIMFSGANQALLLSGLAANVSLVVLTFLAVAASLRHVLYGIALQGRLDLSAAGRVVFAYGLTDEVFATALTKHKSSGRPLPFRWLAGLALSGFVVWVAGTALGNAAGDILKSHAPGVGKALQFALPALFLGLVWSAANRSLLGRMILAGGLSASMIFLGYPQLAIPAGVLPAFVPDFPKRGVE